MAKPDEPLFLTRSMVDEIHETAIAAYGGLRGVLNEHLLESAINQPRHTHVYGGGDLFDIAAAYAFHIVADHPYWDGNKRTGVGRRDKTLAGIADLRMSCQRGGSQNGSQSIGRLSAKTHGRLS